MLQVEHSAILSTFILLPFSIKTFVLSIFQWPLKTGFTVIHFSDRTQEPSLSCPVNLELNVFSESPEPYDVTGHVTSDGTLTFSQQSVTKSLASIDSYVPIHVTAKNSHGTEAYCSFLVTFKGE